MFAAMRLCYRYIFCIDSLNENFRKLPALSLMNIHLISLIVLFLPD